jgi:two-component system phosphate regulon sensor histidine kinase PhoR
LPQRWSKQLASLGLLLAVATVAGLLVGQLAWVLCAALSAYIVRVLYKVYQIDQALFQGKRAASLTTNGLWPELHAKVINIREKSRARKRRHLRLVRAVQESTSAISDAGVILNADHEIVWFNRAARELLGLNPDTDIGTRIANLVRQPEFIEYLQGKQDAPLLVPSPVNESGMLEMQLIPYGRDQLLAIGRDVTHQVHLERTRRDFVANASHELRSPLTVISGYLDTLAYDDDVPSDWQAPLSEMLRQVRRMTQILRDLIELTRLESADEPASFDFVSPREILNRICGEYAARKPAPKLSLDLRSDAGILGTESEVYSIFYNLISNAVRFTPSGGQIEIAWDNTSDGGVFSVEDTGIGIAEEQIPRLTERFYRVDPGRSRASGGTGLGLAIVKHALLRHEGKLEIFSEVGKGSKFICHFPASRIVERKVVSQSGV